LGGGVGGCGGGGGGGWVGWGGFSPHPVGGCVGGCFRWVLVVVCCFFSLFLFFFCCFVFFFFFFVLFVVFVFVCFVFCPPRPFLSRPCLFPPPPFSPFTGPPFFSPLFGVWEHETRADPAPLGCGRNQARDNNNTKNSAWPPPAGFPPPITRAPPTLGPPGGLITTPAFPRPPKTPHPGRCSASPSPQPRSAHPAPTTSKPPPWTKNVPPSLLGGGRNQRGPVGQKSPQPWPPGPPPVAVHPHRPDFPANRGHPGVRTTPGPIHPSPLWLALVTSPPPDAHTFFFRSRGSKPGCPSRAQPPPPDAPGQASASPGRLQGPTERQKQIRSAPRGPFGWRANRAGVAALRREARKGCGFPRPCGPPPPPLGLTGPVENLVGRARGPPQPLGAGAKLLSRQTKKNPNGVKTQRETLRSKQNPGAKTGPAQRALPPAG